MTVLTHNRAHTVAGAGTLRGRSMLRWLLLCAVVSIALRLPFFNVPLGIDEGGDSFVARAWDTTEGSMYGGAWLDRSPLLVLLYKLGALGGDHGVRVLGMAAAILLVAGTMAIAHRISGARAARITGLITAIMTSSVILGAVFTSNELLATVPVTYSIAALVWARDSDRARHWLFASGFLATCALLIKQSFAEVLVAGLVFLVVSRVTRDRSGFTISWAGWWIAGVLTPMLTTLAWFHHYSVGIAQFFYATVGFRVDSLVVQQGQDQLGATYMLVHLGLPILILSGCLLPLPWAIAWLLRHRHDPQLVLPLTAWLVVGVIGITGGGNYFPHYFIQPIAALAVLSGCALAATTHRYLALLTAVLFVVMAVGNVAAGATLKTIDPPQQRTLAVAKYLRDNSHPDDSLYVLYARANLLYYAKMHAPYPYSWTMMVRTVPDAEPDLRAMLRSPTLRPTWIVEWQKPTIFGLDASGETRRLIAAHYVSAAHICGIPILIRADHLSRPLRAHTSQPCPELGVPNDLGPDNTRSPSDNAEYLWQ